MFSQTNELLSHSQCVVCCFYKSTESECSTVYIQWKKVSLYFLERILFSSLIHFLLHAYFKATDTLQLVLCLLNGSKTLQLLTNQMQKFNFLIVHNNKQDSDVHIDCTTTVIMSTSVLFSLNNFHSYFFLYNIKLFRLNKIFHSLNFSIIICNDFFYLTIDRLSFGKNLEKFKILTVFFLILRNFFPFLSPSVKYALLRDHSLACRHNPQVKRLSLPSLSLCVYISVG